MKSKTGTLYLINNFLAINSRKDRYLYIIDLKYKHRTIIEIVWGGSPIRSMPKHRECLK